MSITMIIVLLIIFWFICGVVSAGWMFAYWQDAYGNAVAKIDYKSDRKCVTQDILLGICGFTATILFLCQDERYKKIKKWRIK